MTRDIIENRFLYWIEERHKIYGLKQQKRPKPWTRDEILSTYRFCNVRRANDKVSKWLLNNWYKPYFDHPNMLLACVLARHFNLPRTLGAIGFPTQWRPERVLRVITKLKRDGPVFNGAYIITGKGAGNKAVCVVTETVQQFVDDPPELNFDSMKECVNTLGEYNRIGNFMAGQIVADLRWAVTGSWADKHVWAPVGPGSSRGLCRLLERPLKPKIKQEEFEAELAKLIKQCKGKLPSSIHSKMEAMDWQNCLCEFDKYERVLHGEGRPKQKYNGHS